MNQAMADLASAANLNRFTGDPTAYLASYDLTAEEVRAIRERDVLALWTMGVQPYIMRAFQRRTGIPDPDFVQALAGRHYNERA